MFEDSIMYPRTGKKGWLTIAIGGVLTLLSFLLVPIVFVFGYGARVLRAAAADPETETAPTFDEWGELFVDGLKQLAVAIAYLLVPGLVIALVGGGLIIAAVTGGSVRVVSLIGVLGGLLLATLLFLVAYYVLPAALTLVAVSGRLGAAADVGRLRALIMTREYAIRWLVALGVLIVAGAITGVLSLTGIGALVAPFVTFYATVAAYWLYGGAVGVIEPRDEAGTTPIPAVRPVA